MFLHSQHKFKFWVKLFGEYPIGTLVKLNTEFIHQYPEIWVWFGEGTNDYNKIPSSKFIGRICKKDQYETYSIRWIAQRDRIRKKLFGHPYLHWSPEQFEMI